MLAGFVDGADFSAAVPYPLLSRRGMVKDAL